MTDREPILSEFTWGTVTSVSPVRVKLDGDAAALPFTVDTLIDPVALAVSDRVRVEQWGTRALIVGRSGGDAAAWLAAINAAVNLAQPVGIVDWFVGAAAPSAAWLVLDGSEISRTTYAALLTAGGGIGSWPHGLGNGSTTYNLPDLRERVPVGARGAVSLGTVTFNSTTDLATLAAHGLVDGDRIYFTGGVAPTVLALSTRYYVVNSDASNFQLATTRGGAAINFTSTGSGTRTLFVENFALGWVGGEKAHIGTVPEMAAHGHRYFYRDNVGGGNSGSTGAAQLQTAAANNLAELSGALNPIQSAGLSRPSNVLQPYVALTPMVKALPAA